MAAVPDQWSGFLEGQMSLHRGSWLLAITLLHELELPTLETTPEVAEAAFAIATAVQAADWEYSPVDKTQAKDEEPEDTMVCVV